MASTTTAVRPDDVGSGSPGGNGTTSINWVEKEIKGLYEKLAAFDQKLISFLTVPSALEKLIGRVDLLEGKTNMIKSDVDQLSCEFLIWRNGQGNKIKDVFSSLNSEEEAKQCTTVRGNQGHSWSMKSQQSFEEPGEVVNVIIKQERSYEDENDDDEDWQLPNFGDDNFGGSDDDEEVLNRTPIKAKSASARKHRSNDKKAVKLLLPDSSPTNSKKQVQKSTEESDTPEKIIIKPNMELIARSKKMLGSVKCDPSTGKFPCPTCEKQFVHKKDLVRHHYLHTGIRPYACTKCPESFTRGDKLINHIKMYHVSGEQVGSKEDTSVHVKVNSSPRKSKIGKLVFCKLCPDNKTSFTRTAKLAKHYTQHHSTPDGLPPEGTELKFKCSVCEKGFTNSASLSRHTLTHSKEKQHFPCDLCDKSYTRSNKLRDHQWDKHGIGNEKLTKKKPTPPSDKVQIILETKKPFVVHPCPDCGKEFRIKSKLQVHLVSCRGLRPFSCDECDSAFAQKAALMQHKAAVHQKVKRFLCADCGRSFYGSASYKRHMHAHRGIRPYNCKFCGRSFTGRGDLLRHEAIHIGIRKIQCSLCPLKFYRPHTLKRHMLVHTGEKPFMCDLCGSSFSQNGSLKKHKQCHERGGYIGRNKSSIQDDRKTRTEKKPRESRLLRELAKGEFDTMSIGSQSTQSSSVNVNLMEQPSDGSLLIGGLGHSILNPSSLIDQQYFRHQIDSSREYFPSLPLPSHLHPQTGHKF